MAKSCRNPAPRTFGSDFKAGPPRCPVPPPRQTLSGKGDAVAGRFLRRAKERPAALSEFGPQSRTCRRASGKALRTGKRRRRASRRSESGGRRIIRRPSLMGIGTRPSGRRENPPAPGGRLPIRHAPHQSRACSGRLRQRPGAGRPASAARGPADPHMRERGPPRAGPRLQRAGVEGEGAPAGPPVRVIRGGVRQRPRTKRPAKSAANAPQS